MAGACIVTLKHTCKEQGALQDRREDQSPKSRIEKEGSVFSGL